MNEYGVDTIMKPNSLQEFVKNVAHPQYGLGSTHGGPTLKANLESSSAEVT